MRGIKEAYAAPDTRFTKKPQRRRVKYGNRRWVIV